MKLMRLFEWAVVFVSSKTGVDFKHPLPDDVKVTWLKYVDTDGSQWLESGVRPTAKTHLFADMAFTSNAANQFFGWGSVDSGFTFELGIREGCYGWSVNDATSYEKFETLEVGKRVKFDLQSGSQKLNGIQRSQNVLTKGVANDRGYESTLFLFARKGEWNDGVDGRYDLMWNEKDASSYLRGIPPDLFCTVRFYGCQIWENGGLVRDYIPAQIGDQIGIFDQVNRVFHNGTPTHPYVGGPKRTTGLLVVFK